MLATRITRVNTARGEGGGGGGGRHLYVYVIDVVVTACSHVGMLWINRSQPFLRDVCM